MNVRLIVKCIVAWWFPSMQRVYIIDSRYRRVDVRLLKRPTQLASEVRLQLLENGFRSSWVSRQPYGWLVQQQPVYCSTCAAPTTKATQLAKKDIAASIREIAEAMDENPVSERSLVLSACCHAPIVLIGPSWRCTKCRNVTTRAAA